MCSLCGNNVESSSHFFFHYSISIQLWEWLKEVFQDLQFSSLDLVVQFMKSLCSPLLN